MPATFERDGIRFQYPENWQLEREDSEAGWTVSLQSPDTAFLVLTLDEEMTDANEVAEAALEAMREVYPELEADASVDTVAQQPAVGHDIRFFSLDLTNTCWTRAFYAATGTVLLMCQVNDLESDLNEKVLRAICASLQLDD